MALKDKLSPEEILERTSKDISELIELHDAGIIFVGDDESKRSSGMVFGNPAIVIMNMAHAIVAIHDQYHIEYEGIGAALNRAVESAMQDAHQMKDMGEEVTSEALQTEIKKAREEDS